MDRESLSKLIHADMKPIGGYIMIKPAVWNELARYVDKLDKDSKRLADVREYITTLEEA